MGDAKAIISKLGLTRHPEGGWYSETWRSPAPDGERAEATAIYFLLEAGQSSHWHTVDATEFWLWHAGDPLQLSIADGDDTPFETVMLGPDVLSDQHAQFAIPQGAWQAAGPAKGPAGYTLVSCIVAPGFEFSGFTLAPPDWSPRGEPK